MADVLLGPMQFFVAPSLDASTPPEQPWGCQLAGIAAAADLGAERQGLEAHVRAML